MPTIEGGSLIIPQGEVVKSTLIANIGSNIETALLTASVLIPTNGSILHYLSNDNGTTFEAINIGSTHTFSSTGSMLMWTGSLTNTDGAANPVINKLTIKY